MKTVTTHEAKTHLSRLLKEVQQGESVVILSGQRPVGQLTAITAAPTASRPKAGTVTSAPLMYDPDTFAPLADTELTGWGL